MNLLVEYHKSKDLQRYAEFLACLHENTGNRFIDKIFVFISDDSELNFDSEKIRIVKVKNRPTFDDYFNFAHYECKDDICIIACADIILDESIDVLNKTDLTGKFIALTRWEMDGETQRFNGNPLCQDVWAFKVPLKIPVFILKQMNFTAGGYWGCDNRIAYLMNEAGYEIRNPSLQIKAVHFHRSTYRSPVSTENKLDGPYLGIEPTDDIENPSHYTRILKFNGLGQPIYA